MRFALLLLTATLCVAEDRNDVEFARPNGVSLTLDLHTPEGKRPAPTVIIVHGGGWVNGNKRTYVTPLFEPLTKAGFAWFTINYRLAPQYPYPAALEDVQSAIRWVRANVVRYNLDPKRIVLMGESAGGHLVALAAAKKAKGAEVNAVVDFYGVHDLVKREKERGEPNKNIQQFFGVEKLDEAGLRKLKEASAITYVRKGLPPFLFIHGTKDAAVPYDQSPLMCEALKKAGNRCEVYTVEGAPHGVGPWEKAPEFQGYKVKMVEWLKATLR